LDSNDNQVLTIESNIKYTTLEMLNNFYKLKKNIYKILIN